MLQKTLFRILLLCFCSCRTITFEHSNADLYYEFGDKAHYYANATDDFGIELFHGFYFFNDENRIDKKKLPAVIKKQLAGKDRTTVFILPYYLSPGIIVLQKFTNNGFVKAGRSPAGSSIHQVMDSAASERTYILKNGPDTIFCSERLRESNGNVYKITSYSYQHAWLTKKNKASSFAESIADLHEISSAWKDTNYITGAFNDKRSLLQNTSSNFWKSKNNYLFPLEIIQHFTPASAGTMQYYEASTTFNSFAGNYRKALRQRDSISNKPVGNSDPVPNIRIADVKPIIYDSARTNSVLIINEAHTQPLNRRFFSELLDSLYAIGYKHLFVETLSGQDPDINVRKYPIQTSGYYSSEPNFGNALRKALKIGYTLYPYDNDSSGSTREFLQAQVIADFVKKNRNEKVIVYSGHGHMDERSTDSMMGYYLQSLTGTNPFTIEQTKMVERGDTGYEYDLYKTVTSRYKFTEAQTLILDKHLWEPSIYKDQYDLLVVLPRTQYSDGVPDWQFHYGPLKHEIDLDGAKYKNCILQIFDSKECERHHFRDLVPITNLVLSERNHLTYYLQKGKYMLYVTNVKRAIIYQNSFEL